MKKIITNTIFIIAVLLSSKNTIGQTVTDIDGNIYNVIVIGTQEWLQPNLRTTKLNNGVLVPNVSDNNQWVNLTTSGYCWYNNSDSIGNIYGALYNWHAVSTHKLCPTGWSVPTNEEWTTLIDYLGGPNEAGNKLKEAGTEHWIMNPNATNESGFTGLPAGQRGAYGVYDLLRGSGSFWSATENNENFARIYTLSMYGGLVQSFGEVKNAGKSVRCIKGGTASIENMQNPSIKLKVYPNPSSKTVTIECEKNTPHLLQVIDIHGKVVIEKTIYENSEIELSTAGLYLINLSNGRTKASSKVVIQ